MEPTERRFSDAECERRRRLVREAMSREGIDAFLSDTIVVTDDGCEFLTTASRDVIVR